MSAYNARELGRLVYKYGGVPVASFFSNTSLSPVVTDAMFIAAPFSVHSCLINNVNLTVGGVSVIMGGVSVTTLTR